MNKYFKVPYSNQFNCDKEVLKELFALIGKHSKMGGATSKFKKGIIFLANVTGASNREVKQLIESAPSLRARMIWESCAIIKRISINYYIEILKVILKELEQIEVSEELRSKIASLRSTLASKVGHLSRAEYFGLQQVEGNISTSNKVNKINNSAEIASKLIKGLESL